MRVEIAGALSCGKSTLAKRLASLGHTIVFEDLSTNPYLDLRVQDPEKYDFLCQRQFVLDKIASLRAAEATGKPYFADFSIAAERAYVSHYVSHRPDWISELELLMDQSELEQGLPDLIIHLQCAPEAQLERIRIRGREFEQGHDIPFIRDINDRVHHQVERMIDKGVRVAAFRTDLIGWDEVINSLFLNHLAATPFVSAD
mgnify:CR=1 FL=1|jgi:Deoxynucleoside kinases